MGKRDKFMSLSKAGSFNAYFEFAQRNQKDPTTSVPSGPASLLVRLKQGPPEGVPLSDLAESCGFNASDFHEALRRLADSGFVEVTGPSLSETIKLTQKGSQVAALL